MSIQQFVLNTTLNLFNYYTSKDIPENVRSYNTLEPQIVYIDSEKYMLLFSDADIINCDIQDIKKIYGIITLDDWINFTWQMQDKITTDFDFAKTYLSAYNISKYFNLTTTKIINNDNFIVGSKICRNG